MAAPEWEQERSRLNHDSLRGRLIPLLGRLCNEAAGRLRGARDWKCDVLTALALCRKVVIEVHDLLERFEREMSPRGFIQREFFQGMDPLLRSALAGAVHEVWLDSRDITRLLSDTTECLRSAEAHAADLASALECCRAASTLEAATDVRRALVALMKDSDTLVSQLSRFPRMVLAP